MGRARSTYAKRRNAYRALEENVRVIEHVECPGVDERIILYIDLREVRLGGMDRFDQAGNRDGCRAVVIAVMKLRVP
jgi:hypothetical protein